MNIIDKKWMKEKGAALLCGIGITVSCGCLLLFGIQYKAGREEYQCLRSEWTEEEQNADEIFISAWESRLRAQNPDYVAWLYIPGTNINYPVVAERERDYYLTHTFANKKNSCGCLFVDPEAGGFSGDNVIIFGHNRKDGSMFGQLKEYRNRNFYKEHEELWVCFDGKLRRGRVVSCRLLDQDDGPKADYSPENFTKGGKILTLSSCYGKSKRVIVQALIL